MNKDIFKKAVESITADHELIDRTKVRIKNETAIKFPAWGRRFIASGAFMAVLMIGVLVYNKLPLYEHGKTTENPDIPASDALLPEIKNNYIAFNAAEYNPVKCPAPGIPQSYQELKNQSSAVLVVTIKNIGVYRMASEQYNPKASFGTYIYTAKIDKILGGNIEKNVNDLIPVSEQAWAAPTFKGKEIVKWNFLPYSNRSNDTRILKTGEQYVVFLSNKDETGCYSVPFNGFGIFPVGYINEVASKTTVQEIKEKYGYTRESTNTPLKDDNLYRLSSLYVNEQFPNR
jgi:hypothetical protein